MIKTRAGSKPKTRAQKRKQNYTSPPKQQYRKKNKTSDDDHKNIFNYRSSAKTKVKDDKDQQVPLKTAILINKTNLELKDSSKFPVIDQLIQDKCKAIPSHTELKSVQYDDKGIPISAKALDGTILHPYQDTGAIVYFRNEPKTPHKPRKIKNYEKNKKLTYLKTPPKDSEKKASYTMTPKSHKALQKKHKKNKHKRPFSQNKAMVRKGVGEAKGSATEYGQCIETITPERPRGKRKRKHPAKNWCHLYSFGNGGPQSAENLVAASAHMNTLQIPQDNESGRLLETYPEVSCSIKVSLVPNTHLAEGKLVQTTETEDFTLPFEYDTNERTLPLQCTQFYVKNLFDALVEAHKDQKKLSNPQPTPPAQTLFFEKKADAKTVGTPHIPPNTPTKPMLSSAGTAPASLLPLSGTPQSLSFGTKLITTPPRTLHPTSPVPMSAPNTPIGQTSLSSQPMTPSTPVQLSFTSTLQNKTPSWSLVQSKFIQSPKAPNKGSPLVSTPSQSMHLSFVASVASTPQVPTQKSVSRTSNRAQPKQLNFLSPPAKTPLAKQSAAGSSGSPVVSRQLDFGSPVKGTSSPTPAKLIAKNGMFSPSPLKWVVKNSSPSNGSPRSNSPVGKKLRFGHDY